MIPSRAEIEALSAADFERLRFDVFSVHHKRYVKRRPGPRPRDNSHSGILANMDVGGSHLFETWPKTSYLRTSDKARARQRMKDPAAEWTARLTTKGVRVTRMR